MTDSSHFMGQVEKLVEYVQKMKSEEMSDSKIVEHAKVSNFYTLQNLFYFIASLKEDLNRILCIAMRLASFIK